MWLVNFWFILWMALGPAAVPFDPGPCMVYSQELGDHFGIHDSVDNVPACPVN